MITPRSADDISADIASRIPDGWAWDHAPTSNTRRSLYPLEQSVGRFEGAALAQLLESEPDTASLILDGYERVLGPDTCLGDPQMLTLSQRQISVTARWIASYGASRPELIEVAASYGVPISITEFRRTPAGVLKAGGPRICHPEEFTALITLPPPTELPFPVAVIVCVLRRAAPARCALVFRYSSSTTGAWDTSLWNDGSTWG